MATSGQLARWVAAGLIDSGQADRIEAFEAMRVDREPLAAQAAPATRRVPVIAEAVGYVGVTIVLVAGLLAAEPAWPHWSTGLRLTLIAAVAVALAVAGAAVPAGRDPVWRRLRGLAWLLSVVGLALFAAGLADWVWHLSDQHVGLVTAGAATTYSLVLWLRHTTVPQHLALFVAVTSLTAVVIAEPGTPRWWPGIGVWLVSALSTSCPRGSGSTCRAHSPSRSRSALLGCSWSPWPSAWPAGAPGTHQQASAGRKGEALDFRL